jgi:hypothetical protein
MGQMNHNAAYIYSVDGVTVWERLRVVRNFLSERKKALALAEYSFEKISSNISTLEGREKFTAILETPDLVDNIEYCQDEIKFLELIEKKLSDKAEETRIHGKTDKEMYEINYFLELETRILNKAKAEILTENRIRPETLLEVIKCPPALMELEKTGLIKNGESLLQSFSSETELLLTDGTNI